MQKSAQSLAIRGVDTFLAIVAVDTAENERSKNLVLAKKRKGSAVGGGRRGAHGRERRAGLRVSQPAGASRRLALGGHHFRRIGHGASLFSKLALACIDSYDSEKWRIFSDFSRSTRFSYFRTAPNSKFHENHYFCQNLANFRKFAKFVEISQKKSAKFVEILRSERCENVKTV